MRELKEKNGEKLEGQRRDKQEMENKLARLQVMQVADNRQVELSEGRILDMQAIFAKVVEVYTEVVAIKECKTL